MNIGTFLYDIFNKIINGTSTLWNALNTSLIRDNSVMGNILKAVFNVFGISDVTSITLIGLLGGVGLFVLVVYSILK